MALVLQQLAQECDCNTQARLPLLASHWHDHLTVDQWLQRDAATRSGCAWAQSAAIYALRDPSGVPLASCELWRQPALLRELEGVTAGTVLGVRDVYVPEAARGRGLALELLGAVHAQLDSTPNLLAFQLQCEVRPGVYERAGYSAPIPVGGVRDWEFLLSSAPAPLPDDPARLLQITELPAAAEAVEARVQAMLNEAPLGAVAVLPSALQLDWCLCRHAHRRAVLGQPPPPPAIGAACGSALCLWMFDTGANRDMGEDGASASEYVLRILAFLPGASCEEDAAVLAAALQVAASGGADRALLWATDGATHSLYSAPPWSPPTQALQQRGVTAREVPRACVSTPMLRPVAVGVQPALWRYVPRGVWV